MSIPETPFIRQNVDRHELERIVSGLAESIERYQDWVDKHGFTSRVVAEHLLSAVFDWNSGAGDWVTAARAWGDATSWPDDALTEIVEILTEIHEQIEATIPNDLDLPADCDQFRFDDRHLDQVRLVLQQILAYFAGISGKGVTLLEWMNTDSVVEHSSDFRSVRWHGGEYTFSGPQAACVRILWENWEQGTPDVGGETLIEAIDSNASRVTDLFKRHEAWGTMIVPGRRKGTYRLQEPEV